MKIDQWAYARKYQIKCTFDEFPDTVVLFRQISGYYFIFSMKGLNAEAYPSRKDYVRMEYLLNKELGMLEAYKNRKRMQKSTIPS